MKLADYFLALSNLNITRLPGIQNSGVGSQESGVRMMPKLLRVSLRRPP